MKCHQIDDSVINKFDIRKLRMALVTLAEAGADMSDLVFINPSNSSPAGKEIATFLFSSRTTIARVNHAGEALCQTQPFQDEGMQAFNQAVKETSASLSYRGVSPVMAER